MVKCENNARTVLYGADKIMTSHVMHRIFNANV